MGLGGLLHHLHVQQLAVSSFQVAIDASMIPNSLSPASSVVPPAAS